MRINIYKQIRGFYSLVFESKYEFRPTHISLYMFLLNQNNRSNWVEWFKCPFDTIMMGSCINSNKTYYSVLNDLKTFGLIKYKKGLNNYKAPQISLIPLQSDEEIGTEIPAPEEQSSSVKFTQLTTLLSTGLTTQQSKQLDTQLSKQLSKHKDILITGNYKLIVEAKSNIKGFIPPTPDEIEKYAFENGYNLDGNFIFNYYNDNNWKDSKDNPVKNWKQKVRGVWFKDENKIKAGDELKQYYINQKLEDFYNFAIGKYGFILKYKNKITRQQMDEINQSCKNPKSIFIKMSVDRVNINDSFIESFNSLV